MTETIKQAFTPAAALDPSEAVRGQYPIAAGSSGCRV
jgi:hypothetical protein